MNKLIYLFIGLLAFLAFTLAMAPASLLLGFASERLAMPAVTGLQVEGTLWNASGELQLLALPVMQFKAGLSPLPLVTGTARTELALEATGLAGNMRGRFKNNGAEIDELTLVVTGEFLNHLTRQYGLELSGQFDLSDIRATVAGNWLTGIQGRLQWTGGRVLIQTPVETHLAELPPLKADLALQGDQLMLPIEIAGSGAPVIDIRLSRDGWAAVAVRHAFLEIAGIPAPAGISGEDPAILIEEKIL